MKTLSADSSHRLGEAAVLVCAVLLPTAFFLRAYDPTSIKAAVLQWGAVVAAFAWLWQGLSRGRLQVSAAAWPVLLPALLYGAWFAASFAASEYKVAALPLALNDAGMLAGFLAAFVGFAGARFSARFAALTTFAGWAVVVYAFAQAAGADPLSWEGAWGAGPLGPRAYSSLVTPESCAAFLALLPPLALSLAQDPETARGPRLAAYALLPAGAVAVVLTGSPWGVSSFVAVNAAYALLAPLAAGGRGALRAAGLAAGLAVLVGGAALALGQFSQEGFQKRLAVQGHTNRGALALAARRPLLGVGPGAFGAAYPGVRSVERIRLDGRHGAIDVRPGSAFLGALAETGVVGGLLWLWLFGAALWAGLSGAVALRRAGAVAEATYAAGFTAAAAGALVAAQFSEAWRFAAPGWFLWTLAGLGAGLAALAAKRAPVSAYPFPVSEDVRRALYVPSLLAAGALAVGPGVWLRADVVHNHAVYLAKQGRYDEAVARWDQIPRGAAAYTASLYHRGDMRLGQGRPEEALAYYDRLREAAPDYALIHDHRAEALAKLGRWEEAVAARRRQAELDPSHLQNLIAWAEAARATGDLEEARRVVAQAKAEAPFSPLVRTQEAANDLHERRLVAEAQRRKALQRRGTARKP